MDFVDILLLVVFIVAAWAIVRYLWKRGGKKEPFWDE